MSNLTPSASAPPKASVVIPVWNSGAWLPGCLESLTRQVFTDFEVIVVDNGSSDGSLKILQGFPNLRIQVCAFPENRGFAAAVNEGIRRSKGESIALLNVDTVAEPEWLQALVTEMERSPESVGALASCMVRLEAPERLDDAGDMLSWYGAATKRGHGLPVAAYDRKEPVQSVCAGAALYRRRFFDEVGLFDERFTSYLEDIDLCLRGRMLGYGYAYVPTAVIRHQGHSAGVCGSPYVFLMTRNRLLVLLKNLPAGLLIRHLHQIMYGQFYFFVIYRRPLASLRGYLAFFRLIPHVVRSRRRLLHWRAGRIEVPGDLLGDDKPGPSLGHLLRKKLTCG